MRSVNTRKALVRLQEKLTTMPYIGTRKYCKDCDNNDDRSEDSYQYFEMNLLTINKLMDRCIPRSCLHATIGPFESELGQENQRHL